jgi:hypothetical protein
MPWITFGVIACEKHEKKKKDFVDLPTLDILQKKNFRHFFKD